MVNFTLDELANFSRTEKKLIQEIMGTDNENSLLSPKKSLVNRILDYSKSTSIRKVDGIGKQVFHLN